MYAHLKLNLLDTLQLFCRLTQSKFSICWGPYRRETLQPHLDFWGHSSHKFTGQAGPGIFSNRAESTRILSIHY